MKVEIDDRLIARLAEEFGNQGYFVPESEEQWAKEINALLEEKIAEDFGQD
jgi:5-formaminoimidazole-4-carboxamide-1-beta-D-ribofuranosyl 5'-monophosphate synthetase